MSDTPPNTPSDPLLAPFLWAEGEESAQRLLDEIVSREAMPIIRRIVGNMRLRGTTMGARLEAVDIEHDIVLRLVKRLRLLRTDQSAEPVCDFRRYVGRMSKNVCNTLHRSNNPQWIAVRNKLAYYLSENPQFETWYGEERRYGEQRLLLCGPKVWRGRRRNVSGLDAEELSRFLSRHLASTRYPVTDPRRLPMGELVPRIFEFAGAPLAVVQIVTLISSLWDGGEDEQIRSDEEVSGHAEVDGHRGVITAYEDRQTLRRLWEEIRQLPQAQQKALLLSLRTPQGRDALTLLTQTRTTTPGELAVLLGLSLHQLEKLGGSLPWKDDRIAELLGVTRQQVINLRVSARKRLGRRLEAMTGERRLNVKGHQVTRRASSVCGGRRHSFAREE